MGLGVEPFLLGPMFWPGPQESAAFRRNRNTVRGSARPISGWAICRKRPLACRLTIEKERAEMPEPRISQPGEGRHIRIFGGVEFFVKVGSEESGGGFTLLDNTNPAGTFLPPHVHKREDETFYILEGEFEFTVA